MSTTYTGNPSNVSAGSGITVTIPVDGDGASAASINGAVEGLADFCAHIRLALQLAQFLNLSAGTITGTPHAPTNFVADAAGTNFVGGIGTGSTGNGVTAPDGKTWTTGNLSAAGQSFVFGPFANGLIYYVGVGDGSPFSSPDGSSWTVRTLAGGLTLAPGNSSMLVNSGTYVLAGGFSSAGVTYWHTSPDGLAWTNHTQTVTNAPLPAIVLTDGTTYLFAGNQTTSNCYVYTTTNLTSLTAHLVVASTLVFTTGMYFGGLYCLSASGTAGSYWTSPNGTTWTSHSPFGSATVNQLTAGPGFAVAATSTGLYRTTDGLTWTLLVAGNFTCASYVNSDRWIFGLTGSPWIESSTIYPGI